MESGAEPAGEAEKWTELAEIPESVAADAGEITWVRIDGAASDTEEGGRTLRVYKMLIRGTPVMLMVFREKDGKILAFDGPTAILLPAEELEGRELFRADPEGSETVVEVLAENGLASFTVEPDMAETPEGVILLQIRNK